MKLALVKKLSIMLVIPATLLTLSACETAPTTPAAEAMPATPEVVVETAVEEGVPGGIMVATLAIDATVTAVDKTSRKMTLKGPSGESRTVKVGPEAVNFDQISVGDVVKATLTEELVVYLNAEGEPAGADDAAALVALAPEGSMPAGVVAETIQVTGTVTAIDLEKRSATLQFADGSSKTFPVRKDIDLTQRKLGETVTFRVTDVIALSIEKPL